MEEPEKISCKRLLRMLAITSNLYPPAAQTSTHQKIALQVLTQARNARKHRLFPFARRHFAMKTYSPSSKEITRDWVIVDASDKVLGRLASQIAQRLRGKHKPEFAPHMDAGDFVVVVNADKLAVTGRKLDQKMYYRHSGWIGGLKETVMRDMMAAKPDQVLIKAVKGMLPKNRLGRQMLKKLKVYSGTEHPHAAQQPKPLA